MCRGFKSLLRYHALCKIQIFLISGSINYKINLVPYIVYTEKKFINNNVNKIYPKNLDALLSVIESIDFGVFMDSGPLHVAKIINKKGILIENSVSSEILLNEFNSIKSFKNTYQSKFCEAPCGLTNIFNYKNNYGCFDSLQIDKLDFNKIDNLNSLQRGSAIQYNEKFIDNPVSCLKNIDSFMLINFLMNNLN